MARTSQELTIDTQTRPAAHSVALTVVPGSSLVIFLVLAAMLGLVAATWPARRAARLDVLAAIAS
jgi:putative ABC transport system permease protein